MQLGFGACSQSVPQFASKRSASQRENEEPIILEVGKIVYIPVETKVEGPVRRMFDKLASLFKNK